MSNSEEDEFVGPPQGEVVSEPPVTRTGKIFVREHFPSIVAAMTIILGSMLYFTGDRFRSAKADELGLGSAVGADTLQSTMSLGGAVLISKNFIPTYAVLIASVIITIYVLDIILDGDKIKLRLLNIKNSLSNIRSSAEKLKRRAAFFEKKQPRTKRQIKFAIAMSRVTLALSYRTNLQWLATQNMAVQVWIFGKRRILRSVILIFLSGIGCGLIVSAGDVAGREAARQIKSSVFQECKGCLRFKYEAVDVTGVIGAQSDKGMVIITKDGFTIIPLDKVIQVVRMPVARKAPPTINPVHLPTAKPKTSHTHKLGITVTGALR